MEIKQLRYFLTTARCMNFSRAAGELYLSRQALCQSIKCLEEELGYPLFYKTKNHLHLTAEGEALVRRGTPVLEAFETMEKEMKLEKGREGPLRLGVSVSLSPFLFPEKDRFFRAYRKREGEKALVLSEDANDAVISKVRNGLLDAGLIIRMPKEDQELGSMVLRRLEAFASYGEMLEEIPPENFLQWLADTQIPLIAPGSLEETMYPLFQWCGEHEASINLQVVPETIDAFYRLSHEPCVGMDFVVSKEITMSGVSGSPIQEKLNWEMVLIFQEKRTHSALRGFCQGFKQWYQKEVLAREKTE